MNLQSLGKSQRLLLTAILAISVVHLAFFAYMYARYTSRGYGDFTILYTAGTILKDGAESQLYDSNLQWQVQQQFCDVPIRQGPLLYNHAPYEALLFVPLAWLPYRMAFLVWTAVSLLILLLVSFCLRDYLSELLPQWWVAPLVAIAFFPCILGLVQGQDSILLLLVYTAAFMLWKRHSRFAAGLCIAAGLHKPQIVLPFFLIIILRREWRAAAGFICGALALGAASVLLVGKTATLGYLEFLRNFNHSPVEISAAAPHNMPNLRGLLHTSIGGWVPDRFTLLLLVCASALLVWFAARMRGPSLEFEFSVALIATVLTSYHLYSYDLTVLLLPYALMLRSFEDRRALALVGASTAPWLFAAVPLKLFSLRLGYLLILTVLGWGVALFFETRTRRYPTERELRISDVCRR